MSDLHADALAVLRGWRAPDDAQERHRLALVDHLEQHHDGVWRTCFPAHLTAGTLVLSAQGDQVLLNLHRKARQWFAFGGHCEPGDETLAAVARREAREESGLAGFRFDPVPVQLDAHDVAFCDPRGTVTHLDVRFVATAPAAAEHATSSESLDVRWWSLDALPTDLAPDMHALIAAARARLADQSASSGGGSIDVAAE